jgi:hypothetical protein
MTRIIVTGWRPGFKSISFIKLLRQAGGVSRSLPEAKDLVDNMIGGHPFALEFDDERDAAQFVAAAEELGALTSTG